MRSKIFIESVDWPHPGWWRMKEARAKGLTMEELWFARYDCNETAAVQPQNEGKYIDEATIYAREIKHRVDKKPVSHSRVSFLDAYDSTR